MWERIRPWLFPVACLGCGRADDALCVGCRRALHAPIVVELGLLRVNAAARYDGLVAAAVVALKRGERAYLEPLAALLATLVTPEMVLVPAVTGRRRAAERGFDQARELARRAATASGAGFADVLVKHGGAQRGLGRAARLASRGRFTLQAGAVPPARAVVVDDVVTTGATLRDAVAALTAAGCTVAGALVVAAAPERNPRPSAVSLAVT